MSAEPVEELAQVLEVTGGLIESVRPEQWAEPTPCSEWDVRGLICHLVRGNRMFASILRGETVPPPGPPAADPAAPPGTPPGGTLLKDYRDGARELLEAFHQPGVMDQMFTVPLGTVPGTVALHLRTIEVLVHGWDLARATGQIASFPDGIAERELAFTKPALATLPEGRSPFGPPQPVADTASAVDRLAACLGRPVLRSPVSEFLQPSSAF